MHLFYNFAISIYGFLIKFAALFNEKANKWVKGRADLLFSLPHNENRELSINWFHCASLGEFEQGRPLIEKIKKEYPNEKILLTFYSPSGYEIRKNYELADWVTYLPLDLKSKMRPFIHQINAKRVFIIKYELWFNMLSILAEKKTPTYLISGKFRAEQVFFKPLGTWFLKHLKQSFTHFFVQDEFSQSLLLKNNITQSSIAGDTRIDRVLALAKNPLKFNHLEKILQGKKVIVAGSTWQKENDFLFEIKNRLSNNTVLIIAPHDVKDKNIEALQNQFPEASLWTNIEHEKTSPKIILINCIGVLSSLYQYANVAIIGGGFGAGIHNILEPACFGLPVLFGPKHQKFDEARAMINQGSGFCFTNFNEFKNIIELLINDEEKRNTIASIQKTYLNSQAGATEFIMSKINF
ncbi:MAG: 3-deoxy-D-manno-octulosonic acid transferase [Flavobacteriales bacterium]